MSYRKLALFYNTTFRSIRIYPNYTGRIRRFEVLSFRARTEGFMGSIYHAPMHPEVYHGVGGAAAAAVGKLGAGFFRRFKIPNIKFSRFTPADLFFSAVYRGKLPAE